MAAGVAVGAGTRAYREAGPYNYSAQTPGGSVAVGTATRAAREGYGSHPAAPWTPPPIPAGDFNPIRDIEAAEGKRGSEQAQSGYERERANAEGTYGTNLGLLGQREADQSRAHQETLARLAESYAHLGVRQGDQANAAGTLYGGALISAAAKRAKNEGIQKGSEEARYGEQRQGDENERGHLATALQQLIGSGGSLTEAMTNAKSNDQAFQQSIQKLKGVEASEHGYQAPTAPKVNPLTGEKYREVKEHGKTVHVYGNGRRVVVG